MRRLFRGTLMLLALGGAAVPALAVPGPPCDTAALDAARIIVDAACPCDTAARHGAYVSCAVRTVNTAVRDGAILRSCKGLLKRGAAKSVCGKPGAVTCCRTNAAGRTKCSIKRSAAQCTPPSGGSACVSLKQSCLDACTDTGCTSPAGAFVDAPSTL